MIIKPNTEGILLRNTDLDLDPVSTIFSPEYSIYSLYLSLQLHFHL